MEKIVVKGVEVSFNDLSEKVQEKMYLEDKKTFKEDAIKSQYSAIRKLVLEDKQISSEILDEGFKQETEIYGVLENIKKILEHPNFQKTAEKLKVLIESDDANIRIFAATDEETSSEVLNEMLRQEVEDKNDSGVKIAIMNNPNFKLEEGTIRVLAISKYSNDRVIAAKEETDSSILNEMLRQEVQDYDYEDVKNAIRDNSHFKIEIETIKVFASSRYWGNREIAAKEETDSSDLNKMLRRELQGENDSDVIAAIRNNPNFKVEEATIEVLANSENWEDRVIAAKEETNSSRLNEMLRQELEGQDDSDVKEVIGENPNFELEESTIELLVNSTYIEDRIIVAKNRKVSIEILESMYLKESSSEVLRVIEDNLKERVFAKKSEISFAKKVQIEKVLKKAVKSKGKALIPELLNEILEIIS